MPERQLRFARSFNLCKCVSYAAGAENARWIVSGRCISRVRTY